MLPVKQFETWNKHAFLSYHTQKGEVDSSSACTQLNAMVQTCSVLLQTGRTRHLLSP